MRKDGATAAWRCIAGFWLSALAAYFLTIYYAFWTSYLALLGAIFLLLDLDDLEDDRRNFQSPYRSLHWLRGVRWAGGVS
jgi:hypothetical protein